MRLTILLATLLLVAGCYESNALLLDASQPRQPITTYQDWTYGSGDKRYHARLNPRGDGWYDYSEAKIGSDGSDGDWYKPDLDAARNAGATVKTIDDIQDVCQFTSREQLFAAMRNLIAEPGFFDRVSRAGK